MAVTHADERIDHGLCAPTCAVGAIIPDISGQTIGRGKHSKRIRETVADIIKRASGRPT